MLLASVLFALCVRAIASNWRDCVGFDARANAQRAPAAFNAAKPSKTSSHCALTSATTSAAAAASIAKAAALARRAPATPRSAAATIAAPADAAPAAAPAACARPGLRRDRATGHCSDAR